MTQQTKEFDLIRQKAALVLANNEFLFHPDWPIAASPVEINRAQLLVDLLVTKMLLNMSVVKEKPKTIAFLELTTEERACMNSLMMGELEIFFDLLKACGFDTFAHYLFPIGYRAELGDFIKAQEQRGSIATV